MNRTRTVSPFRIFVNQAGYLPDSEKKAILPFRCSAFEITDEAGNVRFSGRPTEFGEDKASGDTVYIADFSRFTEIGKFRVRVDECTSALFEISGNVYDEVLRSTAKAFYFLRCGCGLDEKYAGAWSHGPCHTAKAALWEDSDITLDITGGWHDAGDYGRYVTPGACAAAHLLYAYKLFPAAFDGRKTTAADIPGDGGMPAILAEAKYELEWLMKMQRTDGAVYHKATTALHAPFVMPENDNAQMYVFPASSMAAADLAAVCALASGIYKPYNKEFSEKLLAAAELSGGWLAGNPGFLGFINPEECNTGPYSQHNDLSNRFWAFTELYSATGDKKYYDLISPAPNKEFLLTDFGHTETGGLGALAYLLCEHPKDKQTASRLKSVLYGSAAALRMLSDKSGYGTAVSPDNYYWGSNMNVMKSGMIFAVNDYFNPSPDNRKYAAKQLNYLLGANPVGISYVTGIGEFRCNSPHLRPAVCDNVDECIPGFVAGGPNRYPADPIAVRVIERDTPPAKCYIDDAECYSLNEVTVYWNSPAVFVLAYLCS